MCFEGLRKFIFKLPIKKKKFKNGKKISRVKIWSKTNYADIKILMKERN